MAKAKTAPLAAMVAAFALAGCEGFNPGTFDVDVRGNAPGGLDTSGAARQAPAERPEPDARGLITYPNYQVAVARRGDTVADVAARIGLAAGEVARFNGLAPDAALNAGAVLALPARVVATGTAAAPGAAAARPDIASVAGAAIERAGTAATPAAARTRPVAVQGGAEPVRHRVARGETAFSIARLYGVTPSALAEWNGLGADLAVREEQILLIPLVIGENGAEVVAEPAVAIDLAPPPSAATALPEVVEAEPLPASPNLNDSRTEVSAGVAAAAPAAAPVSEAPTAGGLRLRPPVQGQPREPFSARSGGLDFLAPRGAPVRAAAEGTVAAITRDTDQVPILILRHAGGFLTVYANIAEIRVAKGDSVRQGQRIASVGGGSPSFLHFELRKGLDAVDPTKMLR
ncbi:peptidoglycan DD-metalloendopeptidase family protein [Jannaschia sp. W003]|uniref:peptidoglycan DD-metalloendopeptidase family protein n=1 Tax=Jannaschia sp. W003 TaxID=2867012 RepID=UPI0021A941E3|nr:peptidoglycan DD-metalloendopeptidase family protein [Jannaschia sp. W003]UWQ20913.1 peptidoglycan DD-metalloendopeptidase family protein [Jannaschia sp. W003]